MDRQENRVGFPAPLAKLRLTHANSCRDLPWYSDEIRTVTPQAAELFEKYSQIEPDKVKKHIKEFVSLRDIYASY